MALYHYDPKWLWKIEFEFVQIRLGRPIQPYVRRNVHFGGSMCLLAIQIELRIFQIIRIVLLDDILRQQPISRFLQHSHTFVCYGIDSNRSDFNGVFFSSLDAEKIVGDTSVSCMNVGLKAAIYDNICIEIEYASRIADSISVKYTHTKYKKGRK